MAPVCRLKMKASDALSVFECQRHVAAIVKSLFESVAQIVVAGEDWNPLLPGSAAPHPAQSSSASTCSRAYFSASHRPCVISSRADEDHLSRRGGFEAQPLPRLGIGIGSERPAHQAPESLQRTESVHHRGGLVAAADHASGARSIAAGDPVLLPLGGFQEFLEALSVAVLQEIAGPLPAENIIGRRTPRRALVVAIAHQEFEE